MYKKIELSVCMHVCAGEQRESSKFACFAPAIGLINTHWRVDNAVAESRSP